MTDAINLDPPDAHNRALLAHVHPADWEHPTPAERYNLVVVGGGTAGLVSAAGAAGLGAKVALIERSLLGGDCLNLGCVPSKALLRSAKAAHAAQTAGVFGVPQAPAGVADFAEVMTQLRALRAGIARHDAAARFCDLGVDVFLGAGQFTGRRMIEVDGNTLHFQKAVIATGARASAPPIPGLDQVPYLTNESLFSLTELPPRLAVIGAGPIGVEMAQAFARLGSQVHLLDLADRVLPRESADASRIVGEALAADGVVLALGAEGLTVAPAAHDEITLRYKVGNSAKTYTATHVLVAVGRKPNLDGLGLDAAGIKRGDRGQLQVDDKLRTTNKRVFAAGDVASRFQFTHTADAQARIVIRNALFPFLPKAKTSKLVVPWVTYSDPEVAHVGFDPADPANGDARYETVRIDLDAVDRAILDRETAGFLDVHVHPKKGRILGATFVGAHAGETISQVTTAMAGGLTLGDLAAVIHPYPTQAEALKRAADLWNRGRLTPFVKKALAWIMARQR